MRRWLLFACMGICLRAAILDRLAITVGRHVITELQLDEELRVTAFLNHEPIVRDSTARRAAANRLIAQLLIEREMRLSRYPSPQSEDIDNYFDQIKAGFGSASQFHQALAKYHLTEAALKEHLALQLTTLRFIEDRFRPDVGTPDAEERTDAALDAWLEENRKQVNIVYQDKSLQ